MEQNQKIQTWQWVVTVIVIIILIVLGYYMILSDGISSPTTQEKCERRGMYMSVTELPASCLKYFKDEINNYVTTFKQDGN